MRTSLSLVVAGVVVMCAHADASVTLVRDGASPYTIVRPADASPSQVYAAEELQRFTRQMTGAELPIVTDETALPQHAILLGVTRHTATVLGAAPDLDALGDDGFRLAVRAPHVCIIGSPVRGTLYGVYELLERYGGCRWYASHFSIIPKSQQWTLPDIDGVQTPAFAMREPFWWDMFHGDFAARCRANGNRMELTEKHGGKVRFGGGLFVHTFYRLLPPDQFFADHPEYYSEINGKRTADHAQLCLTNPDVVRLVSERLLDLIRKDPDAKLFSVSQNDWHGWCTCANCRALDEQEGSHAGTVINFVNQVAANVEKEFPDVWIETLAYQYTRHPPKTIRPRHNVVPRLCTIECDFSQPLNVSPYEQNRRFVEDIRGWSAITDKLYVWDYTTNFAHYIGPHPNFPALQGNVQFFRDNHVVGLFEQGAYQSPHAEFAELRAWVLAKLLWNPDQDVEKLYDDFFHGYYGAAADTVRQYFVELQALAQRPEYVLRIGSPPTSPWYSDEFFERAAKLWQRAGALVKDDPDRLFHVRMDAMPVMYARLARWRPMPVRLQWQKGRLAPEGVDPAYAELARELLVRLKEGRVTHVAENAQRHQRLITMLRERTEGLEPRKLVMGDTAAAVVPESGGRVLAFRTGDHDLLRPEAGGVDFADVRCPVTGLETPPCQVAQATTDSLTTVREVRGRYQLRREVRLADSVLHVEHELVSRRQADQTIYPVLRAAVAIAADAAVVRVGDAEPVVLQVPGDQTFATFTLPQPSARPRTVTIGSPGAGWGTRIRLPDDNIDRLWLQCDAILHSARLVVVGSQSVPAGAIKKWDLAIQQVEDVASAAPPGMPHSRDRVRIEECMFSLGRYGQWGELTRDVQAEDGWAAKLFNTHYEWCLQWRVDPQLFTPGSRYHLRMRIRVEKSDRHGKAFWAGVYDTTRKRSYGQIEPETDKVEDGYQWYDIATWTPEQGQYLWVGPGRFDKATNQQSAIEALYVDRFELIRQP